MTAFRPNSNQKTESYATLKSALSDTFLVVKLEFMLHIAMILEPFLTKFQSSAPMIPYVYDSLLQLVRLLLSKVLKCDIMESSKSATKIARIDLDDNENLKPVRTVDIGIGATVALKKIVGVCNGEKLKYEFLERCQRFIVKLTKKIWNGVLFSSL